MDTSKIILIGPSGVGKTTLRKVIFDQDNASELLHSPLEPTYGIETTNYELGCKIVIHDLAGQQIEEWLDTSNDIFFETNIIIVVLDAHEDWETLKSFWTRVVDARLKFCPASQILLLFHKIDLLSNNEIKELEQRIKMTFDEKSNITGLLTSIEEQYFFKSLMSITNFLHRNLHNVYTLETKNLLTNLDILNLFYNQTQIPMTEIYQKIVGTDEIAQIKLNDMISNGIVSIDFTSNIVKITEKGETILQNLKHYLNVKIQLIKGNSKSIIHGLILADYQGKAFAVFEDKENFFKNLVIDPDANSDPTLIAMFFSAIGNFGTTLDKDGFSTIHISGKKIQIVHIYYQDIFGLFFLNERNINSQSVQILQQFIEDFYKHFEPQIKRFVIQGFIKDVENVEKIVKEKVINLDLLLQNQVTDEKKISKKALQTLFLKLNEKDKTDPEKVKQMKNKLLQYLINEDDTYLQEIQSYISQG